MLRTVMRGLRERLVYAWLLPALGATNLVTGVATAFMDSIPMVALIRNVGVSLLGRDSFQEIDITGVTMRSPNTISS